MRVIVKPLEGKKIEMDFNFMSEAQDWLNLIRDEYPSNTIFEVVDRCSYCYGGFGRVLHGTCPYCNDSGWTLLVDNENLDQFLSA